LGCLLVTQATQQVRVRVHEQPQDMWAAAALAGAPWGLAILEQSAFCPQAADAAIAVRVTQTMTTPATWMISMAVMDI
jgi:hypothetical protein